MSSRCVITLDSFISWFPPSKHQELCRTLVLGDAWKRLAEVIPRRDNSGPRFTSDDIAYYEFYSVKAPEMLLRAWSTDVVTFRSLINCLETAELKRQAEFVRSILSPPEAMPNVVTPPPVAAQSQPLILQVPHEPDACTTECNQLQYCLLAHWTNNFDVRPVYNGGNLLGQGGFADVFKGLRTADNKPVAVKRLKVNISRDDIDDESHTPRRQFENEVRILTRCHHDNVVSLIGYSTDGPYRCLVYEFMSKGSLDDRLACRNLALPPLTVQQRLSIARDTVRGLVYLHTVQNLIHMDVKSANILLDDELRAKVGDYGITRFGPSNPGCTSTLTDYIIGTKVYMAPEHLTGGRVSFKVDAYSFGVVLLELLTGLAAQDQNREDNSLVMHVRENCGDTITILDNRAGDWSATNPQQIYQLAVRLTTDSYKSRPKLTEIQPEVEGWVAD